MSKPLANNFRYAKTIVLICLVAAAGLDSPAQSAAAKFVKDEILVKFQPAAGTGSVEKALNPGRYKRLETLGDLGWQRLKLPPGISVEKAIEKFKLDESVEAAQPNYYYSNQATPNDPIFNVPPPDHMYGLVKISAPQAWDLAIGSSSVVVAVIDTGARLNHEDLVANLWTNAGETPGNGIDDDGNGFVDDVFGYDFQNSDAVPADDNGHGTHISGTIGAAGNNGIGVVGVNWTVRIMPVKVLNSSGSGGTSAMIINAYNYVRMMKNRGVNIRVTNNSYGGCNEACGYDQATKDAIDALGDADILNVFAAGNGNTNIEAAPFYPASYTSPSILSVAASTSTDARAGFSNWGTTGVDLAAPGLHIISTVITDNFKYNFMSGTSMAAPHVSGAAALLSSLNPSLSAASLKASILNNVDALPEWSSLVKTGGRLNVSKALQNQTICGIALETNSIQAPTKGGLYRINVTAPQNCDYSIKRDAKWVVVNDASDRSGNSQVAIRVRVNDTIRRQATIKIGSQTLTVSQSRDGN